MSRESAHEILRASFLAKLNSIIDVRHLAWRHSGRAFNGIADATAKRQEKEIAKIMLDTAYYDLIARESGVDPVYPVSLLEDREKFSKFPTQSMSALKSIGSFFSKYADDFMNIPKSAIGGAGNVEFASRLRDALLGSIRYEVEIRSSDRTPEDSFKEYSEGIALRRFEASVPDAPKAPPVSYLSRQLANHRSSSDALDHPDLAGGRFPRAPRTPIPSASSAPLTSHKSTNVVAHSLSERIPHHAHTGFSSPLVGSPASRPQQAAPEVVEPPRRVGIFARIGQAIARMCGRTPGVSPRPTGADLAKSAGPRVV
jgi:hypothetical protein